MSGFRGPQYVLQTGETGGSERSMGGEEERTPRGRRCWKFLLLSVKLMQPFFVFGTRAFDTRKLELGHFMITGPV